MSFVFCEMNDPESSAGLITALLKKNKNTPGLPGALLKTAAAFEKKGEHEKCRRLKKYLIRTFPLSNEAGLVMPD